VTPILYSKFLINASLRTAFAFQILEGTQQ